MSGLFTPGADTAGNARRAGASNAEIASAGARFSGTKNPVFHGFGDSLTTGLSGLNKADDAKAKENRKTALSRSSKSRTSPGGSPSEGGDGQIVRKTLLGE